MFEEVADKFVAAAAAPFEVDEAERGGEGEGGGSEAMAEWKR